MNARSERSSPSHPKGCDGEGTLVYAIALVAGSSGPHEPQKSAIIAPSFLTDQAHEISL